MHTKIISNLQIETNQFLNHFMNNLKIPKLKVDLLFEIWVKNVNLNIHSLETFVCRLKKKVNKLESRLLFYINKSK